MEMQRIKAMFNDDSAVSPVIGVILMVAITVILAAVIASFVLGLGDQGDPAPTPTIQSEQSQQSLNFSVTGGDSFDPSATNVNAELTLNGSKTISLDGQQIDTANAGFDDASSPPVQGNYNPEISGDEVSAGDEFSFGLNNTAYTIEEWEVEVVWDPADSDSQIIYSDSS